MNKKAKNNTVNTKVLKNDSSRDEIGVSKKKLVNWLELDLNLRLRRTISLSLETRRFVKERIGLNTIGYVVFPSGHDFFGQ